MSPKLFIRADSATTIGIGHMMRCIAIAQAWQERGGSVTFLSHCQSEVLRRRIREEGCEFVYVDCPHPDPKDLKQVIEWLQDSRIGAKDGWFVLDGYCFGADYQKVIKKAGLNLLLVDDY
jgi:UDP-2,4-diacetamido-2,4,6-trideoxy-beta-L-altropyranose hydrolase